MATAEAEEAVVTSLLQRITKRTGKRLVKYTFSYYRLPEFRLVDEGVSNIDGRDPSWNPGFIYSAETVRNFKH